MTRKRFTKLLMSHGFKLDLIKLLVAVIQTLGGKISYVDAYNEITESILSSVAGAIDPVDSLYSHLNYIDDERVSELNFTPLNAPDLSKNDVDDFRYKIYSACGIPSKFLINSLTSYVKIKPFEIGQIIITNENKNNLNIT